jgi:hypothetical protein
MDKVKMEYKMVVYTGGNYRIKRGLCPPCFSAHGLTFNTGVVYKVTDKVFEFLKGVRGFQEIKGLGKDVMDFPRSEKNEDIVGKRSPPVTNGVCTSDEEPVEQIQTS